MSLSYHYMTIISKHYLAYEQSYSSITNYINPNKCIKQLTLHECHVHFMSLLFSKPWQIFKIQFYGCLRTQLNVTICNFELPLVSNLLSEKVFLPMSLSKTLSVLILISSNMQLLILCCFNLASFAQTLEKVMSSF